MSLVNNMLRDLDQRRKESDSSGAGVRLMPAREFVEVGGKNLLPFVLVGLVLLVAALAYYWVQLGRSDSEQQLDIRVQPLASNSASDSERLIQELEESIVEAEESAVAGVSVLDDSSLIAALDVAPSAVVEARVEPRAERTAQEPDSQTISIPENLNTSVQAPATGTPPAIAAADPRLVREGPIESVKEAPEFSTEQLDTIAVQKALSQIADGQTDAAYGTLEEYIIQNRHAHQSRETYAKLLMSQGRVVDANALVDAGLELAPNHSGFKKVKARLLMASGQVSEAVDILISRAPDVTVDAEYHDLLASAQLSSRDFSGAIISYTGLVQTDETQGKWWYGFASAHDQLGNILSARQAYTRAMQFSNLSASLRRRSQERLGVLNP